MRKLILLYLLFFSLEKVYAQNSSYRLDKGNIVKEGNSQNVESILGFDGECYYVLKKDKSSSKQEKFIIEKYNSSLDMIKFNEIVYSGKKESIYDDIFFFKNQLYAYKNNNKKISIYGIDKSTLSIDNDKFFEINTESSEDYTPKISKNQSHLLFYAEPSWKNTKGYNYVSLCLLDENMFKLWERKLDTKVKMNLFDLLEIEQDNKGNVILLGLEYFKKRKRLASGEINYRFHLFKANKTDFEQKKIELDETLVSAPKIVLKDDSIVLALFYSEKVSLNIDGIRLMIFDKANLNLRENYKEKLKDSYKFECKGLKNSRYSNITLDLDPFGYRVMNLFINQNGSFTILAEQKFMEAVGSSTSYGYVYSHYDLALFNFSSDGKLMWYKIIPKIERTEGGHIAERLNDDILLVYFINKDNLNKEKGDSVKKDVSTKSRLFVTKVNQDGMMEQKIWVDDWKLLLGDYLKFKTEKEELILILEEYKKGKVLSKISQN